MTRKTRLSRRITSIFLCAVLIASSIPFAALIPTAAVNTAANRTVDPSTLGTWTEYFPTDTSGEINTENAGGIWTDKSVMTSADEINALISGNDKVAMSNSDENLLVALSTIGSNMSVTGMAAVPTDTVIILDMSNSISNASAVPALATAANTSVKTLFEANPENRVAIVSYNSDTSVLLPLGSYSAGRNGDYLTGASTSISIVSGVTDNKDGSSVSGSVSNKQGTNTQAGVKAAIDQLASRTLTSGRLPVVILLTDGEPTIANFDIANLGGTKIDLSSFNSSTTGPAYAFLTQLTIAYMKEVAFPDMLFYTIGVGSGVSGDVMQDVVNPVSPVRSSTLRGYWNTFNNLAVGESMTLGRNDWRIQKTAAIKDLDFDYVSKITDSQNQEVNGYFAATSNNLAADIEKAFEAVMKEIISKSVYTPTLLQGEENFSGYVSFVDKIGKYMDIDSIKGVIFDDVLRTGEMLAGHFATENSSGGSLVPYAQMSALGKQFVDSVAQRLAVTADVAYNIIENAWNKGWISYTSAGNYSNWFGWLSDARGSYIGIWDGNYPVADANAAYINRSYAMLGNLVNDNDTTDMMYSTIRVRERISDGEKEVNFAIPASLIPTITYKVSLDENKALEAIDVETASPIRLVYEVKLDDAINSLTVKDIVDADYLAKNTDPATGAINFYSNQYETVPDGDGKLTGYSKVNTYSYFRPSRQNDRYYYQTDALVYSDTAGNGTPYVSDTVKPHESTGKTFYYKHQIYSTAEGIKYGYHTLPYNILETAKHDTSNDTYVISAGTVRADYAGVGIAKSANPTGTLTFSHEPFNDVNGAHFDDTTHRMVVGTTLANNGRISLSPATGIRLTKSLTANATVNGNESFEFTVKADGVDGALDAYKLLADGSVDTGVTSVSFTSGVATVSLKAGETVYIGGLADGTTVTVTEAETLEHTVHQVKVNGSTVNGKNATLVTVGGTVQSAEFVNGNRGVGSYTLTKVIEHELGTDYTVPEGENTRFAIELKLTDFEGKPVNGTFTGKYSSKSSSETVTFVDGIYKATLTHHEQLQIDGLPEGSTVRATEQMTDVQKAIFNTEKSALYYENRVAVTTDYAEVAITANNTASAIVENFYAPNEVYPVNVRVEGTKTLVSPNGSVNTFDGEFRFELQKRVWNGSAYVYQTISTTYGSATVTYNGNIVGARDFAFDASAFANEKYGAVGRYAYRVIEIPNPAYLALGVSFDATVHGFEVEVTDKDMDGKLEINDVHIARPDTTDEYHETVAGQFWHVVSASFENRIEQSAAEANIEIQKTLLDGNGAPIADASGFRFEIADVTDAALANGASLTKTEMDALFEGATASLATSYSGIARAKKSFDTVGTHIYAIRELTEHNGTASPAGYTFDTAVKFVKVTVTANQSGDILVATAVNAGSAKLDGDSYTLTLADGTANADSPYMATVGFENSYAPLVTKLDIDVKKQLNGRAWTANDVNSFRFELVPANGGTHTPSVLYNANGTAVEKLNGKINLVNTADGAVNAVSFGSLVFKQAGIYFYDVYELPLAARIANGVVTDTNVYGITVTVTDVNGQLKADSVIIDQENNDTVTFVNNYEANPVGYVVSGNKSFTNGVLYGEDFTFVMTNTADATEVYTTKNRADGSFTFPEIIFTKVGTYNYKITELTPPTDEQLAGVNYNPSGKSYTVTFVIADDNVGNLFVKSVSDNVQSITITNTYTPEGTEAVIGGNKVLIGERALEEGEFEFALYKATDSWTKASETPVQTVKNLANGEFRFNPLGFDKMSDVGLHRYIVEEVQGNKGGVSYDITEYRVVVAVTNDYNLGRLNANTFIFAENGNPLDAIAFVNTYSTSGSIVIEGNKTLNGRDLLEGEFEFDIYQVADETAFPVGDPLETAYNTADGAFRFELGNFTASGDYYFIVRERVGNKESITYDASTYLVKVVLTDDKNGRLVYNPETDVTVSLVGENGLETVEAIEFVNTYEAKVDVDIEINKTVENKGSETITPEGFEFLLEGEGERLTVKTGVDGKAVFTLNYTEADIGKSYTYKLTEINDGRENVKYSDEEYIITVSVTLGADLELVANVTKDGLDVDTLTAEFVNEYNYTPPSPPTPPAGDTTQLVLWFAALFVSGGVAVGTVFDRKSRLRI